MTTTHSRQHARRRAEPARRVRVLRVPRRAARVPRAERPTRLHLAPTRVGASLAAFALVAGLAIVSPNPVTFAEPGAQVAGQSFSVPDAGPAPATAASITRDAIEATPGVEAFVASGTNEDWAKLVLMFGEWPITESNVTVMMRWMRQENYERNWWQRNNPLNNGYGSGGGAGFGSYDNLVIAAEMAAGNLKSGRYPDIAAGFAASAPTAQIEKAIWVSPWASSHYQNGTHWHYHPWDVVKAPASAWGDGVGAGTLENIDLTDPAADGASDTADD